MQHLFGRPGKRSPHPDVPAVSRYVTPDVDLDDYDSLIIGGVSFYFAENSKDEGGQCG